MLNLSVFVVYNSDTLLCSLSDIRGEISSHSVLNDLTHSQLKYISRRDESSILSTHREALVEASYHKLAQYQHHSVCHHRCCLKIAISY